MAWVAVDKSGVEGIFRNKPIRYIDSTESFWFNDIWCEGDVYFNSKIILPKGLIKKLIGRDLTWEDEPVELKEE